MSAGKYRNILQYIIRCIPRYCLKIYGWLNPHVWFLDAYVAYLVMSTPSRTISSWSNPSIFVRLLHQCPLFIIKSAEEMGLRLVLLSCLFVTLGKQKTFSLYYYGCRVQQMFYQNPLMRKTLLSLVWWKPGEVTRFSPGFWHSPRFQQVLHIHQTVTKF